jgi:hypothetical protein
MVLHPVISFIVGYGHWGYGATDIDIGGSELKAVNPNCGDKFKSNYATGSR